MNRAGQLFAKMVQVLKNYAWAPLAVLVFHAIIAKTHYRVPLDWLMHSGGGLAIAWFFHGCLAVFREELGVTGKLGHGLLMFSLSCTAAVFWEFAEFVSDAAWHTHIQRSLAETMGDLFWGALGALLTTCLAAVFSKQCR